MGRVVVIGFMKLNSEHLSFLGGRGRFLGGQASGRGTGVRNIPIPKESIPGTTGGRGAYSKCGDTIQLLYCTVTGSSRANVRYQVGESRMGMKGSTELQQD